MAGGRPTYKNNRKQKSYICNLLSWIVQSLRRVWPPTLRLQKVGSCDWQAEEADGTAKALAAAAEVAEAVAAAARVAAAAAPTRSSAPTGCSLLHARARAGWHRQRPMESVLWRLRRPTSVLQLDGTSTCLSQDLCAQPNTEAPPNAGTGAVAGIGHDSD